MISEKKKGVDVFYTLCSYYYTLESNTLPYFGYAVSCLLSFEDESRNRLH